MKTTTPIKLYRPFGDIKHLQDMIKEVEADPYMRSIYVDGDEKCYIIEIVAKEAKND